MQRLIDSSTPYFSHLEVCAPALFAGIEGRKPARETLPDGVALDVRFCEQRLSQKGAGCVSFSLKANHRFGILLSQRRTLDEANSILLDIGESVTCFRRGNREDQCHLLARVDRDSGEDAFLDVGAEQTYWLSLDSKNRRLRFGKGQMLSALSVFEIQLPQDIDWLSELEHVALAGTFESGALRKISARFWQYPVTCDIAPVVNDPCHYDWQTLADNSATLPAALPEPCRRLYSLVSAPHLNQAPGDFPNLFRAVDESLTSGILAQYLKASEPPSGLAPLNIAVGEMKGDLLSSPMCLNLWPGHYDTGICHVAHTYMLLRVIRGELTCQWFRGLEEEEGICYRQSQLTAGQSLWLTPGLYHTLRLVNSGDKACVTWQACFQSHQDGKGVEIIRRRCGTQRDTAPGLLTADWQYDAFKASLQQEDKHRA